jgi:gamma-glutamylaminecyclotransferase
MYVFVYGTILSGMRNNHRVKGCKLIGKAETTKQFYMTSLNSCCYPMVSYNQIHSTQNPTTIKGEVYEINHETLQDLDYLEGHPNFYTRQSIEVKIEDGDTMNAFCYIILQPDIMKEVSLDYEERSEAINDGDWRGYYMKFLKEEDIWNI